MLSTESIKNRLAIVLFVSFVLVVAKFYKALSEDTNRSPRIVLNIPDICLVTHNIQLMRNSRNTSHINPAREVVEELLQIVKYNSNICSDKADGERLVVTIVDTARDHFKDRELIRRTWGSVDKYKNWHVRTVFLIGQSDYCVNETTMSSQKQEPFLLEEKTLLEELHKNGDLVIGAFTDTYRNLTYKHLMGYKFVQEVCSQADFIIKTDDDMFVDVLGIIDNREKELQAINGQNDRSNSASEKMYDIYCHNYKDAPTRDPNGKWFSTLEEWAEDEYPLFCLGNDYAISMDWLKKIYSVRGLGGFFWVDDVFIMGKLREIAEKSYNESTNKLNMWATKKMTDPRGMVANWVKDHCEKDDFYFGWFVFLSRWEEDFMPNMECLWRKALRNANITTVLYSFRAFL